MIRVLIFSSCILGASLAYAQIKKRSDVESESKVGYSTKIDFDSSLIDGQMRAPSGFFLQGKNKQDLQSMVQLRTNFRRQLLDSKSAIEGLIP